MANRRPQFQPEDAFITVPYPRASVIPRGINSPHSETPQRTFRIDQESWDAIGYAAEILGMSGAEFLRWMSITGAHQVLRDFQQVGNKIDPKPIYKAPRNLNQIKEQVVVDARKQAAKAPEPTTKRGLDTIKLDFIKTKTITL